MGTCSKKAILPYCYTAHVLRARIDSRLEMRFRELAMRRFGYGKGALTRAIEEAIIRWISQVAREEVRFEGDPVEAIDGIISDVDVDSVELQHRIRSAWLSEVLRDVPDRH